MTEGAATDMAGDELPDGWVWTSIGTHYAFKNGLNKAKRFFGQGTPIINYMDVFRHQRLSAAHVQGKVTVTNDEADAYSALQGDAFFTRTSETVSEIGYSAVLLQPIQRAVFSGFVLRGRPKTKNLLPEFAAYALRARDVRKQIESRATYTTRALTNGGSLSECVFLLPKEPEQQAIAQALSDIDDLIASLDALIAKKRDIKQGAMQQLLTGKRRLPGFSEEWLTRPVGSQIRMQVGCPFRSEYFNGRSVGIRIIRNRDLKGEGSPTYYSGEYDRHYLVQTGDVLIGMDGDFSPCIWRHGSAVLNQRVGRLQHKRGISTQFFYYLLAEPLSELERTISGTTVKHLSHSDVEKISCHFPIDDSEQLALAEVFCAFDQELNELTVKQNKCSELRQGMIQQLLTGRISLT